MDLIPARNIANRIVQILQPFCHKIHIAGSIRREKPEVKDIEIVVLPFKQATDLFNDSLFVQRQFKEAAATFVDQIEKGGFDGRYCKLKLKNTPIICDMFLPVEADYYRQLTIRTGDADYVAKVIAARWAKMGYCGAGKSGLRKITDCIPYKDREGKNTWQLIKDTGENPAGWKSEEQFFEWLQIAWVPPQRRFIS